MLHLVHRSNSLEQAQVKMVDQAHRFNAVGQGQWLSFRKTFKFVSSVAKSLLFPLLISVHQWQLWVFPRDPLQTLVTWMPCGSFWISSILAPGSWDDNAVLNCPQPLS